MEDIMHIRSSFLRRMISSALGKVIRKQGYDAQVSLNDIRVSFSEKDEKVRVHLDVDAQLSKNDLVDILTKAGVI